MQGSSGDSLAWLLTQLTKAVKAGADGAAVGESLFAAADVLRQQPALRRTATDPSMPGEAKSGLVRGIFESHLDEAATDVVVGAAGRRWAASSDLTAALERLGVVAVVKSADADGEGDRLEAELFMVSRVVAEDSELRDSLSDPARSVADKQALVRSLLEGKASAATIRLAERSVSGVHLTVNRALDDYTKIAAEARNRLVSLVRVAKPLEDAELKRLAKVLKRQYDRPVHLNVVVDPTVLGGVRIEIGDDVIDGTVAGRLDEARRRFAG
ncbi:MAG: F0F1 ATP synthase subunit delta [Nocardioidaceae bacterium]